MIIYDAKQTIFRRVRAYLTLKPCVYRERGIIESLENQQLMCGLGLRRPLGPRQLPPEPQPLAEASARPSCCPTIPITKASVSSSSMFPLLPISRRCAQNCISALRQRRWYSSTLDPAKLPLAGIRVLDLTRVLAGVCLVLVHLRFSAN